MDNSFLGCSIVCNRIFRGFTFNTFYLMKLILGISLCVAILFLFIKLFFWLLFIIFTNPAQTLAYSLIFILLIYGLDRFKFFTNGNNNN